ncbi:MAG TPA: carboxypeptidase-like regulatory domain-containing protein [Bryobacteraceae bacterium]|nr:carboxypeptidase-like regulatory domain-containing protein [Bryobacteraceae bacterium]
MLTALAVAIVLSLSAPSAMGQGAATTGVVNGQITDAQNAAIAGADIRLVDTATGSTRTTVSNDVGRYTIPSVPPGVYDLTITKAGFEASKLSAQKVDVGQTLTLNVTLQIGATTTTVEVQASAGAELQTLNATVGTTMTNTALNVMPNMSRDVSTLASLQVGVSLDGNVAGAATDQNKFQLDGGNNSDDMAGTNTTYVPGNAYAGSSAAGGTPTGVIPTPVESIEEFKINTTGQTADFGGAAGSQVQMVTKRGTNQFHGAAYEYYFSTDVGAANDWKSNHTADPITHTLYTPLPKAHRNRFGGALGGQLIPKKILGGKTYFFVNYEQMQFPNAVNYEAASPTATYRAGVILLPTANGNQPFNINTAPVTVNGVTYPGCGATSSCDPRGLGVNPLIQSIWSKMPLPNDPTYTSGTPGDGYGNSQGYLAPLGLPEQSKFIVGRIDHDFGDKNKFMVSYRDYNFPFAAQRQMDMSGQLCGTSGTYCSASPIQVKPDYWVAGLTTTVSANITNDFRFSYLRNFWNWSDDAGVPQQCPLCSGLGGVVEIGGESNTALIPYNVRTQSTRQRFWDGHDYFLSDSLSQLHGNHLFSYGGSYLRANDLHSRNDNGVTIDTSITYLAAESGSGVPTGIPISAYTLPPGVSSGALSNYANLLNQATGILAATQLMYTRSGAQLTLNPPGEFALDHDIIPTYDAFVTDTWHIKPSFTLSYGVTYELSMPPYELNGKQVQMVDAAGNPINIKSYMTERQQAALQGQIYEPEIGFDLIGNAQGGANKYPYNPFYGGFSPHVSAAWNPDLGTGVLGKIFGGNKTVIRGGYGRIYGRANGVDLVLVPLLGPGLLQGVQCIGVLSNGTCGGTNGATPVTAYRIGVDGLVPPLPSPTNPTATVTQTLPQPFFPGAYQNGVLNPGSADGSQLDPNFRPDHSDEFTFTLQRSFSNKMMLEVGYIGRKISNEFQEINLDATPNMLMEGGQSFSQAYANVYTQYCGLQGASATGVTCLKNAGAVTPQPFFENVMGGTNSAYCAGFSSCTAAVISHEGANFQTTSVNTLWIDLAKSSSLLAHSMLELPMAGTTPSGGALNSQLTGAFDFISSYGHGSYNAFFTTFKTSDWHGLTTQSNFTWGRALGTGSEVQASSSISVPNPFDFNNFGTYGIQPFDVKFTYNLLTLYQEPWFRSQQGLVGRILGGWTLAPIFTARSGLPLQFNNGGDAQSFGEVYSGQSAVTENAAGVSPYTGGSSAAGFSANSSSGVAAWLSAVAAKSTTIGTSGNPATGGTGLNMFNNPIQVASEFRPLVLGVDSGTGGAGTVIRGFPYWNLDVTLSKDIKTIERINLKLIITSVNVLNHFTPNAGSLNIQSLGAFGVITSQYYSGNGIGPRWMEFGLRLGF